MAPRDPQTKAGTQAAANDPWASRRRTDPVLRGVIAVLARRTDVSYHVVDWRPFLFGATCPAEEAGLRRGLIQDPDDICGSHSIPFDEGGGGYLERFAQSLGERAEQTGRAVSAVVVEQLRRAYDGEVWARSADNDQSWLGGLNGTAPRMTFAEAMAAAHWTDEILVEIDAEVAAQRGHQANLEIDVRGGQLDLFA